MKKYAFLFILISTAAIAWVSPPNDFFQQWTAQNKSIQTMLIKQERDLYSQGAVSQTFPETIKIKRPGLYKWTSMVDGQENVKILGKTKAMLGVAPNFRQVKLMDVISPLEASVIYGQAGNMESVLKQIDIDIAQYGLELFQHEAKIRVGSKTGNRLYIASATNTLDAMVYKDRLYLFQYNAQNTVQNYPTSMEIYEGDTLKEKIRVLSVSTTAKFSDLEFEPK